MATKLSEFDAIIKRVLSERECEFIEFKVDNSQPESIGERISALSNGAAMCGQNYGYLVFGVEDGSKKVVGTVFNPFEIKVGNEELEHWLVRLLNPRIDFSIKTGVFEGKSMVYFQIQAAPNRPVAFSGTEYVRIRSLTKKLKDYPEKERKLWLRPDSDFETELALQNVPATDVIELLDTQSFFSLLLKKPYPSNREGVLDKLLDEKMIVRSNGHFHITNLGAILFAKDLESFDGLAKKAPRVVQYKGNSKMVTLKDQVGKIGYAAGFERTVSFINALLPSNEIIGQAFREEVTIYPPLAIRELVANALIHQNFKESGSGPMVEIFEDRLEISNPGEPIINVDRFIDDFRTRNDKIAAAMRRMGFCEEKGSGIDKVIELVEHFQLPAPDFRVSPTHTKVILFAHQNLLDMTPNDKIRACYQHCVLHYIINQNMTNQTLRNRLGISEDNYPAASKIISNTMKAGKIKLEDPENRSPKLNRYIPFWA